jgi:hypothetical protein
MEDEDKNIAIGGVVSFHLFPNLTPQGVGMK